jgi:hypothetical protein
MSYTEAYLIYLFYFIYLCIYIVIGLPPLQDPTTQNRFRLQPKGVSEFTRRGAWAIDKIGLNCLNKILRSAARLVGGISRFDHVSAFMGDDLHWLPLQQRILFRVISIAWRCVFSLPPSYLCQLFTLASASLGRRSLRSATRGDFLVPFSRTATMQQRSFSVVGPTVWNDLPLFLCMLPCNSSTSFHRLLKTFLFDRA